VRFLERSFGELLEGEAEDADFIALHGVWSWIGEEPRQQVLEFMRRKLKPGGIVYISYNCLPGVAQIAPLQRLLNEHASLGAGDRMEKMRQSMAFAAQLQKAGARFFADSPIAAKRLADMSRHDPHYLAHEYYNANWVAFFHADVARALAGAKLSYAASAALIDNFEPFIVRPEIARLAAGTGDSLLAETVKDFARNQQFRRDVFARGAARLDQAELEPMLARTRFALSRPRPLCMLRGVTPAGEVTLDAAVHAPVLDALARSPLSFEALAASPEATKLGRGGLRKALFALAALGNVGPALPAAGEQARRSATAKFNRVMRSRPVSGNAVLASPVLGAGVSVDLVDRVFIDGPADEGEAVAHATELLTRLGLKIHRAGKPVEVKDLGAVLAERASLYFRHLLPFYRQLGVLD
jgi:SAM-dependent methyltransferase